MAHFTWAIQSHRRDIENLFRQHSRQTQSAMARSGSQLATLDGPGKPGHDKKE